MYGVHAQLGIYLGRRAYTTTLLHLLGEEFCFESLFIFATQKVDGSAVPSISSLGQAKQRWNLRAHHFFLAHGEVIHHR
jgi:hypothetical protein